MCYRRVQLGLVAAMMSRNKEKNKVCKASIGASACADGAYKAIYGKADGFLFIAYCLAL